MFDPFNYHPMHHHVPIEPIELMGWSVDSVSNIADTDYAELAKLDPINYKAPIEPMNNKL